jgi:DNA-directed RNA polymerase sigma subunit (sigma70/sigma32)
VRQIELKALRRLRTQSAQHTLGLSKEDVT